VPAPGGNGGGEGGREKMRIREKSITSLYCLTTILARPLVSRATMSAGHLTLSRVVDRMSGVNLRLSPSRL